MTPPPQRIRRGEEVFASLCSIFFYFVDYRQKNPLKYYILPFSEPMGITSVSCHCGLSAIILNKKDSRQAGMTDEGTL